MKGNFLSAKALRKQAREQLRDRWGIAIMACLIVSVFGPIGCSLFSQEGMNFFPGGNEFSLDVCRHDFWMALYVVAR